jgi:hypothetical protein
MDDALYNILRIAAGGVVVLMALLVILLIVGAIIEWRAPLGHEGEEGFVRDEDEKRS